MLRPPRQDVERVQIGMQILIGFMDTGKALDGAAVDHDLVVDGLLDLRGGDGHILHLTEDIGELHANEFYVFLPHQADNVFLRIFAHIAFLL